MRIKFHANLMTHNFDWLAKQASDRGISMNAALNDLLAELRMDKKSGTETVQKSCVENGLR